MDYIYAVWTCRIDRRVRKCFIVDFSWHRCNNHLLLFSILLRKRKLADPSFWTKSTSISLVRNILSLMLVKSLITGQTHLTEWALMCRSVKPLWIAFEEHSIAWSNQQDPVISSYGFLESYNKAITYLCGILLWLVLKIDYCFTVGKSCSSYGKNEPPVLASRLQLWNTLERLTSPA